MTAHAVRKRAGKGAGYNGQMVRPLEILLLLALGAAVVWIGMQAVG